MNKDAAVNLRANVDTLKVLMFHSKVGYCLQFISK